MFTVCNKYQEHRVHWFCITTTHTEAVSIFYLLVIVQTSSKNLEIFKSLKNNVSCALVIPTCQCGCKITNTHTEKIRQKISSFTLLV